MKKPFHLNQEKSKAFTSDDFFFSPFPISVRPTIPVMFLSCVQQLEKGDFLVAKMRDKIQSAG